MGSDLQDAWETGGEFGQDSQDWYMQQSGIPGLNCDVPDRTELSISFTNRRFRFLNNPVNPV
ncbi:MAG: hypothetical protein Fur0032_11990 [Terrimicrobiaceae bacterium]